MKLTHETRCELKEELARIRLQGMFGDGMELEYVWGGVTIVGLNEMSDEELVLEYSECFRDDDGVDPIEPLLLKCRLELHLNKIIAS